MLSRLAGLAALVYAPYALAIGEDVTVGNFSCSGGTATGQLLVAETSCPASLQLTNIFSFLMCNMEQISSNILGNMYCGMILQLTPAVWALATLAVTLFGAAFTIGLVPATGREALLFIIKIAFVSAFATNADLIISYTYAFFIGGMREGVGIALSGLSVAGATSGNDAYAMLDGFLYNIFKMVTDTVGQTDPIKQCQGAVFAAIAIMAAVFPMFGYLALLMIGRILMAFYSAVFGYIYALVGLTFVVVLSPFFVPMFWFKLTRTFFDRWLGYLVSFSLQMVLIFAALTFILSINPANMVSNMANIVMYWEEAKEGTSFRLPWQGCTFCDFEIIDAQGQPMAYNDANILDGKPRCKSYPVNYPGDKPNYNPSIVPDTDSAGHAPITLTFAFAPGSGGPTSSQQMNSLIKLAGYGFVAMIVLAVVLTQVMLHIPRLAQVLASSLGAGFATQLGGGTSGSFPTPELPGQSLIDDFKAGFDRNRQSSTNFQQVQKQLRGGTNEYKSATGTLRDAVNKGATGMVTGRQSSGSPLYDKQNTPGMSEEDLKTKNEGAGSGGAWRRYISGGL